MKYCLLFYVLWRWRLFWCFHTAFNIYAKKTGLFHFNVTFAASPGSMSLLYAGVESATIINQAPKEHYWPATWRVLCWWFFSSKSVEKMLSRPRNIFLFFSSFRHIQYIFFKANCDWHLLCQQKNVKISHSQLKMNNSKRLNWKYLDLCCKQISELAYSVKN